MSTSVSARMSAGIPEYGLAEGDLWRHSVRAALAAETIRSAAKVPVPPETSTAALLHDVGKLVLCRFLGPGILHLLKLAADVDHLTPLQAEQLILEVNHGELGGLVAQHWRLPDTIVRAISYHHTPEQALEPIAFAVHLANLVSHRLQGEEEPDSEARIQSMVELGIDPDRWETICATVATRYEELAERYS
jgi:HD-like signal output (HDOD) protein